MIKLGAIAKDKVTTFQGVVMGKAEYLTGCNQLLIQPQNDMGTFLTAYPEARWFDEGRLEFVSSGINGKDVQTKDPGCDYSAPSK